MPLLQNLSGNDEEPEDKGFSSPDGFQSFKMKEKQRKCRRLCCIFGSIFLVIVFLSAVVILVALMLMVGKRAPKVQTNCGIVQGDFETKTNVFIFKGVPYAAAPSGEYRWKPTRPLDNSTCWEGIMLADRFPEPCAQSRKGGASLGSEDCLYLNIYSPDIDPLEPLPVLFYIHGGYLQFGHINSDGYVPDEQTAKELGVVLVNIQYRLNAFGWFVSHALPQAEGYTGNYGLLDQIQALKWVQENIRNFGGDPDQVTVYGQSSGGTSVMMLLSTPMGVGLFNRAWIISGSPILNKTYSDAADYNEQLLNKTKCSTKECLHKLNITEVLNMVYPEWDIVKDSMDLPTKGYFEPALPVIDGEILPNPPFEQWDERHPGLPDVPVIVGTTAQEVDFEPAPGLDIEKWSMEDLFTYVERRLGPFNESFPNKTMALYPVNINTKYPAEYAFTTMTTDVRITCGNDIMTTKMANALTNNVYRYVVTSFPSQPVKPLNFEFQAKFAFHTWDTYAFFDTFRYIMSANGDDHAFRRVLQDNVMHFVNTGQPLDQAWLPFRNNATPTALISNTLDVNASYNQVQCDFWNKNGFFPYSWIN